MTEHVRARPGRGLSILAIALAAAMGVIPPGAVAADAPPILPTAAADAAEAAQPKAAPASAAADLAADLARLFQVPGTPPTAVRRPNGTLVLDVRGRFLHVYVVRRNPDGTLAQACVSTPEEALAVLRPSAPAAQPAPALEER